MWGTVQIKKKRGWGDPQAWGQQGGQQQGGWGGQQQGGGWGGQQQGGGWGGQQQGGGWGGQQQGGGWGGQQQGGQQQGQNLGMQFAGYFGNPGGAQAWGNNMSGKNWIQNQQQQQQFNFGNINQMEIADFIEQQIIQLQPSPAKKTIDELRQKGEKFVDKRFPPNNNSLCGEWGNLPEWKSIQWAKISDKLPNAKIFVNKPNPRDIKQGYLGDCYFLAGLAALSERPDRIFNLFLLDEVNDVKYYSCKILYKGKWITVDMDQCIPYMSGAPAFSKSIDQELWVMLLEKAWAKIYTSYKRTEAGYPEEPLHDLTGAPIKQIYTRRSSNKDEEWNYLYKASQLDYSMVCSSNPGSDADKSQSGVVQGHAYTLLKVDFLNFQGQQVKLVQLRNPWGKGEFKGAWSDYDQNWNAIDPNEKKRIGFDPDCDDGIFFIPWDNFWNEFRAITIAEIDDNASYIYKSHKDQQRQGCYFSVEIKKQGLYSLQVDKTPERSFEDKLQNSYNYPRATVDVGVSNGGSVKKLKTFQSNSRTTFEKFNLQPGTYIVKVVVDFDPKWEKEFEVNLAVYAQYPCLVKLATNQQASALAGTHVSWTGQEPGSEAKPNWNNLGAWGYESGQSGWGGNTGGGSGFGGNGGNGGGTGWGGQEGGNSGFGGGNNGGWGGSGGNTGNQGGWGGNGGNTGNQGGWGGGNQGGGWGGNSGQGGNQGGWGQEGGNSGWGGSSGW